ncbi:MAG: hypothetical protein ACLFRV_03890 [Acidimicrobiales bacterium]
MPRTGQGRGGARQGQPGQSYSNRTDMNTQPVRTGPSTGYGQRTMSEGVQQQVPLPAAAPPPPFGAPTGHPGEPVTAGMARGPGPGPGNATTADDPIEILHAVYQRHPNEGLRRYLAELESNR